MAEHHDPDANPRPTHIDLPTDNHAPHDEPQQLQPSGERPPPARGILKNARPTPAGVDPAKEQSVHPHTHTMHCSPLTTSLTWDEANIALTEIQKDSLM